MSLISKVAKLASSPQGRRALQQARTRLDTPENRQRLNDAVGRVRSSRTGRAPGPSGGAAPPD